MSKQTLTSTAWWKSYRNALEDCDTHRVEVFFRSLAPRQGTHDRRKQVFDELKQKQETGLLDGYSMNVVGEGLCLCEQCQETRLARHLNETLRTLRECDAANMEPLGFSERVVDSSFTDETYTLLVPPEVSLAVYIDDSLQGVFPSSIDGTPISVGEFLTALADLEPMQTATQAQP